MEPEKEVVRNSDFPVFLHLTVIRSGYRLDS